MYQLRGRLGRWGFGEIYEAVHEQTGKVRMLKLVRGRRATDPSVRRHLAREYRVGSQVSHPNVMKIDAFEQSPALGVFLAMDRVEGETLARALERKVAFSPAAAGEICRQAAEGLAAAHREGFGHYELSPEAILLRGKGGPQPPKALITGFGAPPPEEQGSAAPTLPLEAMPYAAPERRKGARWGEPADVFSVCALLMHLLTGNPPPTQGWDQPPDLPSSVSSTAISLHEIAERGIRTSPATRPRGLAELAAELGRVVGRGESGSSGGERPTPGPARPVRQKAGPARKTTLGMPAYRTGRSKKPPPPPPPPSRGAARGKPTGDPLRKTVSGMGAATAERQMPPKPPGSATAPTKHEAGGSGRRRTPPMPPAALEPAPARSSPRKSASSPRSMPSAGSISDPSPAADVSEEKLDLVTSEAAADEMGEKPLEPTFFPGSTTGAMQAVDEEELGVESPPLREARPSRKKTWMWTAVGALVVVAVAGVVLAAVIRPWSAASGAEQGGDEGGADTGREAKGSGAASQPIGRPDGGAELDDGGAGLPDGGRQPARPVTVDGGLVDGGMEEKDGSHTEDGGVGSGQAAGHEEPRALDRYVLYLRQGRRAMRHGRYKLARRQFTKALRIRRRSYRARRYMGEAHYRAREHWAAVHWFKKALKMSPRSASTHLRLGRAYMKVGKRAHACRHFKKAFKLRPNSRTYRRYLENYRCK
jgi:serine/threonine-protein kinase